MVGQWKRAQRYDHFDVDMNGPAIMPKRHVNVGDVIVSARWVPFRLPSVPRGYQVALLDYCLFVYCLKAKCQKAMLSSSSGLLRILTPRFASGSDAATKDNWEERYATAFNNNSQ